LSLGAAIWIGALTQSWNSPWHACILAIALFVVAGLKRSALLCALGIAILLGSGVMSFRQMSLERSQISHQMGVSVSIEFRVTTDPTKTKARVFGSGLAPTSYSFLASARVVKVAGREYLLRTPIRIFGTNPKLVHLLPGQKVSATGVLKQSKESRVAANFLIRKDVAILTPPSRWALALASVRNGLTSATVNGDAGALIPGMVLGDTSLQTDSFRIAMKRSGLTHLVAVSGANFAIISLFVLWCAQWFLRSIRVRLIFTAVALACFIALVRPSPSVLRAAAMASVVLVARGAGKRADPIAALGFAIGAVIIGDPWQAGDPGFALSVLATAGLLLLAPHFSRYLSRFIPNFLADALSIPIAAVVMCAPILAALSGYFGLMSVLANLLAAPMVAPITIIGFIAALISPFAPAISHLLLSLIYLPAAWIAGVARWAAHFPVLNVGAGLRGFLLIAATLVILVIGKRIAVVLLVFVLIASNWIGSWPGGEWELANCDVGQGDSLVINLGQQRAIVIDTGPDPQIEDRCLSQLGIKQIPLLVLTHFHADHVGGLAGLLRKRTIENVWISNENEPLIESHRVRNLLAPLVARTPLRGTSVTIASFRGPVAIKVLWPLSSAPSCEDLPGQGSAINNSSIALDIRTGDFSLFASGDLEPCPQAQIVEKPVDILKVAHHGSAYQDFALLEHLRPTISIISVGAGNSYGHPAPRTVSTLARLRSRIYRTDLVGSIAVRAHDHRFSVRTSGGAWWKKVRLG